ncbi:MULTISPECIES: SRPBCC domain-containing protein [unclassified Streptomyces]|uniref:SRPBCC domain-containing protein n=1 Tax=unclassified Streptomyces TaxID=2593676 RepID=UPI003369EDFA
MEHEVFVPFPVDTVRLALTESDRVARCVPGLQQDADAAAGPLAGRLRVRIGGSTITYRGSLRIAERGAGFEVEGEGTEARGSGSVKLALTVVPKAVSGGTTLVCSGTVRSEGRLAEFDEQAATTVARRLLDRFGTALAGGLESEPVAALGDAEDVDVADEVAVDDVGDLDDVDDVSDLDGLEDVEDIESVSEVGDLSDLSDLEELGELDDEPPAEAAHARRTMIGRSTEEVDHAPPRGRYAPVPAPETVSPGFALRWAAPAAAVVIASAVVVSRVLRRRK